MADRVVLILLSNEEKHIFQKVPGSTSVGVKHISKADNNDSNEDQIKTLSSIIIFLVLTLKFNYICYL